MEFLDWCLEKIITDVCGPGCFAVLELPLAGKGGHSRAPLFLEYCAELDEMIQCLVGPAREAALSLYGCREGF